MELLLRRDQSTAAATLGELSVDGQFECYTCEDVVRAVKIKGDTAISVGRYQVVITMSNRFKRELPLLLNVPNFDGIRIHTGNTAEDTEGCILVGQQIDGDSVRDSRPAFAHLFPKIQAALQDGGECWITIEDA